MNKEIKLRQNPSAAPKALMQLSHSPADDSGLRVVRASLSKVGSVVTPSPGQYQFFQTDELIANGSTSCRLNTPGLPPL